MSSHIAISLLILFSSVLGAPPVQRGSPSPAVRIEIPMFHSTRSEALRLRGHKATISAVSFSPDGQYLASADQRGVVKVWSLRNGKPKYSFDEHRHVVPTLAFSPDGRYLASAGGSERLIIWDLRTGLSANRIKVGHETIISMVYARDGKQMMTHDSHAQIKTWNLATGQASQSEIPNAPATAFSSDGRKVVTASRDGVLQLWEVASGQVLRRYQGHGSRLGALAISPDLRFVASGRKDAKDGQQPVRIWDQKTAQLIRSFHENSGYVHRISISPNGRYLVAVGRFAPTNDPSPRRPQWSSFTIWDIEKSKRMPIAFLVLRNEPFRSVKRKGNTYACAFSPDSRYVATGGMDRDVHVWTLLDHVSGITQRSRVRIAVPDKAGERKPEPAKLSKTVVQSDKQKGSRLCSPTRETRPAKSSSNGDERPTASIRVAPKSAKVEIDVPMFDPKNFEALRLRGHQGTIFALAFSPDGRYLASGDHRGVIKLWDLRTGAQKYSLIEHKAAVRCLSFSKDGRQIVSTCSGPLMLVWNVEHGRLMRRNDVGRIDIDRPTLRPVVHTLDANLVHSYDSMGRVGSWNLDAGRFAKSKIPTSTSCAFSDNGQMVLTANRAGKLQLWEFETGKNLNFYAEHKLYFSSLAISPDGRFVAAGSLLPRAGKQPVRVWHLKTAKQIRRFEQNARVVIHIEFSPNGRYLGAAGPSAIIFGSKENPPKMSSFALWDVRRGHQLQISFLEGDKGSFKAGSKGYAYACTFSPDSRYAATGGMGADVHVWKLPEK